MIRRIRTLGFALAVLGALLAAGCAMDGPDEPRPEGSAASAPKMVMLTASYCPVCRQMEPVVDELGDRCRSAGVAIEKIDVAEEANEHLIEEYRVVGVPTFLFVAADGAEVARLIGRQTPETLTQALAALGGEECPGWSRIGRSKSEV